MKHNWIFIACIGLQINMYCGSGSRSTVNRSLKYYVKETYTKNRRGYNVSSDCLGRCFGPCITFMAWLCGLAPQHSGKSKKR